MVLAILGQGKASKLKTPKSYIYLGDTPFNGDLSELAVLKSLYEMEVQLKKGKVVLDKSAHLDQFKFQNQ